MIVYTHTPCTYPVLLSSTVWSWWGQWGNEEMADTYTETEVRWAMLALMEQHQLWSILEPRISIIRASRIYIVRGMGRRSWQGAVSGCRHPEGESCSCWFHTGQLVQKHWWSILHASRPHLEGGLASSCSYEALVLVNNTQSLGTSSIPFTLTQGFLGFPYILYF